MTEALCGLIENIKKEEKESKKIVSLQEHPGKKKKGTVCLADRHKNSSCKQGVFWTKQG